MQPGSAAPKYWKFDASSRGGLAVQLWLSLRSRLGLKPKVQVPDHDSTKLTSSPGWVLDLRGKDGKFPLRLGEDAVGAGVRQLGNRVVRSQGVGKDGKWGEWMIGKRYVGWKVGWSGSGSKEGR